MPRPSALPRTSATASSMAAPMSSGPSTRDSPLISARICRTVALARHASSFTSLRISRTSSMSMTSDSRYWRAAWALLTMAVSGWSSSWASEPASSPMLESRDERISEA